ARPMSWLLRGLIGLALLLVVGGGVTAGVFVWFSGPPSTAGLVFHEVKREKLQLTIVERGALESADNKDVVCKVKAGSKNSTIATTIKWVIDDGTDVRSGDKLAELDDSGLQEQLKTQRIAVEQARAADVQASANYRIVASQNEKDIATARLNLE